MSQIGAGVGQAVEVILTLTAGGDDTAVPQECEVMADGRLALAKLRAQGTDVAFAFGKNQDDLKPGRIAHVLQ
jgi:hypothetical protein